MEVKGEFAYFPPENESYHEDLKPELENYNITLRHANTMREKSNSMRADRQKSTGLVRTRS
jgi:hypothetical protein